ncbi:MAG TPA: hypothetical protein VGN42_28165, partial [Pirellulales bacterium]|nr:hypothetical protein [Pirellulales bacterium]
MPEEFDVYRKWLGIPPAEQPANYYRLLGVGLFENDADAISNAADRQMAHVRTFQNGPRSLLSQRLLNELAAARVCLLKPAQKAEYDRALQADLARRREADLAVHAAAALPLPQALPLPLPVARSAAPLVSAAPRPLTRRQPARSKAPFYAGVVAALLVGCAAVLLATSRKDEQRSEPGGPVEAGSSPPIAEAGRPKESPDEPPGFEKGKREARSKSEINAPASSVPGPTATSKPSAEGRGAPEPPLPLREATGEAVDILKRIDIQRDVVRQWWRFDEGGLLGNSTGWARLQTQVGFPEEYKLTARVERTGGGDCITFGLSARGKPFSLTLDGQAAQLTNIAANGQEPRPPAMTAPLLTNKQAVQVEITVLRDRFRTTIDEKPLFDWPTDYSTVATYPAPDNPAALSLMVWGSTYRISELTLTPLSGEAPPDAAIQPLVLAPPREKIPDPAAVREAR